MNTNKLTGAALDWAVAKCEGYIEDCCSWLYEATLDEVQDGSFHPSTDWAQGGPIIERERIEVRPTTISLADPTKNWSASIQDVWLFMPGPTPLIAAMRCYVASKLGDTVDIPKELL